MYRTIHTTALLGAVLLAGCLGGAPGADEPLVIEVDTTTEVDEGSISGSLTMQQAQAELGMSAAEIRNQSLVVAVDATDPELDALYLSAYEDELMAAEKASEPEFSTESYSIGCSFGHVTYDSHLKFIIYLDNHGRVDDVVTDFYLSGLHPGVSASKSSEHVVIDRTAGWGFYGHLSVNLTFTVAGVGLITIHDTCTVHHDGDITTSRS
ncbi:hypothetical protein [Haliangium sp.]|uniref:hypothetical protein n=1 Tax=Haliangium sp. TaxID=2663208 RepID=UPI003D1118B3